MKEEGKKEPNRLSRYPETAKKLLKVVFGSLFQKFLTTAFIVGASLVGGPDLWEAILGKVIDTATQTESGLSYPQKIGTILMIVSFVGHIVFFLNDELFSRTKIQKRKAKTLAGKLTALATDFSDPNTKKSAGFKAKAISECIKEAKDLIDDGPTSIASNTILHKIASGGPDASGEVAIFGVTTEDMFSLANTLNNK